MSKVIPFDNSRISSNIQTDVRASLKRKTKNSNIQRTAQIDPLAAVKGNVYLGKRVVVAHGASIRGYEDRSIWVGDDVKIQDCAVLHAVDTYQTRELITETVIKVGESFYGAYIGDRVILTQQCQVHGPACIGADTFVGMQSLIFKAIVGENCIIEPKALIMGVEISDGRYVPAGALITTQAEADELPVIAPKYLPKNLEGAVAKNLRPQLATGYQKPKIQLEQKLA